MKKKTIFLLSFCLISLVAHANSLNIFGYHYYINKAEINIATNHLIEAQHFYDSAFKQTDYPMAKDLYNALLLSIKAHQTDKAFSLAKKLALKGVGTKFFLANKEFEPLRKNTNKWNKIIQIAKISSEYLYLKNKIILQQIDSLLSASAKAQKKWSTALNLNDKHLRLKATSEMTICGFALKKLFEKYGYLSEDIIGANIINDTTINPLPIFAPIIENELTAYIPNLYEDTSYNHYLYPALIHDKIDPETYALLQNEYIQLSLGVRSYFILNDKLYTNKAYKKLQVNMERSKKQLCKLEESEQKTNFLLCHPRTSFVIIDYSFYKNYPTYKEIKEDIITHIDRYKILKDPFPQCINH